MRNDKQIEAAFDAAIDNSNGDAPPRHKEDWIAGYKAAIEASHAQCVQLVKVLKRIASNDEVFPRKRAQDALANLPEELK